MNVDSNFINELKILFSKKQKVLQNVVAKSVFVMLLLNIIIQFPAFSYGKNVVWDSDQVLGQNGDFDFAGIYEFDNLTIGDDVEITSSGISQLVLYVRGTLTLGKNVAIRVRNGFYSNSPKLLLCFLKPNNLNYYGIPIENFPFRLYPYMYGKGGDGGDGGWGHKGRCSTESNHWTGHPRIAGGGGFGGGDNGDGNCYPVTGSATSIGNHGRSSWDGRSGGGNGGNGGNGIRKYSNCDSSRTDGGGGGGYGGGILNIIADSIKTDVENPPKFLVQGQKGGLGGTGGSNYGEGSPGENGEGGLLIIECPNYSPVPEHWNLNSNTYGTHTLPSINGGHGVEVGNPQKVFINGYEPRTERQEEIYGVVSDLATGTLLDDVTISILGSGETTKSLIDGSYSIPLTPGNYDITFSKTGYETIIISDVVLPTGQARTINIELTAPGPLNPVTTSLAPAETPVHYFDRVRISGGIYPYIYTVVDGYGILPPGLSLNSEDGYIYGTPTTPGIYTFSVSITDLQNSYTEREFSIEVTEKLEITTEAVFSRGTKGTAYFGTIAASGGTLPHSFVRISGSLPSGISLTAGGSLTGTPSRTGSYDFTVRVTDASGRTAEKAFHIEIVNPLVLSTTHLNNGIVGTEYSQTLTSSGGFGAHVWVVSSAVLPNGLSLNSQTGILSGTPTDSTSKTIVFAVSDEENRVTYKDLVLQICDPLTILTAAVPNALVGSQYSEAVRLNGGIGPYKFSYVGQLPAGLSLNTTTGAISGTPTTAGFVNVSISVNDTTYPEKQSVTQNLGIRTTNNLTITTSAVFPKAKKDVAMNPLVLQAGGGPSPYTWTITDGQMPSGISLDSQTGQISGTPVDRGDFVFTIKVTDNTDNTIEKEFFLHVSDTLKITTGAVPDGAKGKSYSFSFAADGGLLPHTWRVKTGTLPSGLSFNGTTGTLYGTPTTRQTYSFTLEVSDNDSPAQTAERKYTIEIQDELYIYTRSVPNGRLTKAYSANFQAMLGTPPYKWSIEKGVLPQGLTFTGSPTLAVIEGTPTEKGTFVFTVKVSDDGTPVTSKTKEFTIKIYDDVVIETTELKNANRGIAYSEDISVSGGAIPYTWKITEGSLPAGLTLNSTSGHISGITNLVSGHSSILTVQVTDSGNPSGFAVKKLVLWVLDPLEITTNTIQKGLQKAPFQADFKGEGGIAPFTWSKAAGALPSGMTIDPETGILSGTPAQCGTFDFTLGIKDAAEVTNSITKAFQMEVICCNDYRIEGAVKDLAGVSITLAGDADASFITDAEGAFYFDHLAVGNYTLTPSLSGYKFEPSVIEISDLKIDKSGFDFAAHVNHPPALASNPAPGDKAVNLGLDADLSWTGKDPDAGDTLLYDIYFGTTKNPALAASDKSNTNFDPGVLNPNTVFYWKIVTKDNYGMATPGPVWKFTTLNRKPLQPAKPIPQNKAIDMKVDTTLSWTGGDPDAGDTVVYDVYFGTKAEPVLLKTAQTGTTIDPGDLNGNTTYYWKIVSRDSHGAETSGPVWQFTTANHLPYEPSKALPENNQEHIGLDTQLSWTGGDPDAGDMVVYDVYFGISDAPPLVVTGQSEKVYEGEGLKINTTYYWKITVRDDYGGETHGPVWQFKTITPGQIQFKADAFSVMEDQSTASITLTRTKGSDSDVFVTITASDGTARSGMDYTFAPETILFAQGETGKTIDITILDDGRLEGDETINLTLSNPKGGAVLGQPITTVLTIHDDGLDVLAGDVDGSGTVDLSDLKMTLQIMSREILQSDVHRNADINGDGKIGIEEAIYILQKVVKE